mgnify:CR=1
MDKAFAIFDMDGTLVDSMDYWRGLAREYLALEKRGASLEELEKVTLGGLRRAVLEGDVEMGSVMSGQVAGMLHEIRPVAEIFRDLYESGIARAKATAAEWSDAE